MVFNDVVVAEELLLDRAECGVGVVEGVGVEEGETVEELVAIPKISEMAVEFVIASRLEARKRARCLYR